MKVIKGTLRKVRDKPELELPGLNGIPKAPAYLNDYARAEWDKQISGLVETGIISDCDLTMFETMCYEYGMYRSLQDQVNAEGRVNKKGAPNQKEYMSRNYLKEYRAIAAKFGLTPADRTSLSPIKKKPEEDPLDKLIREANA